jgi:predicted nucleotidyltransferase component of viral defense system
MNSSGADYKKLYKLQDRFLTWWVRLQMPFYMTGGTALGRFYLNHRYSDDLDFFVNNDTAYLPRIEIIIKEVVKQFQVNIEEALFSEDFTRFYIDEEDVRIKVEFVNDVGYYSGKPVKYKYGLVDTPINILSNKLTAIVGRDEPKDMFDIIHLALNYSFKWEDVFLQAKQKAVINEIDVEQRLFSFPTEWLKQINVINQKTSIEEYRNFQAQIANDFLLGSNNSLGREKQPIEKPVLIID